MVLNMDNDLLQLVAEDIEYITKEWNQVIADDSLRRSSNVLRNLIVYGKLLKAAKMMNIEIKILLHDSNRKDSLDSVGNTTFYQAGGAKYKGLKISKFQELNKETSNEEAKKMYKLSKKQKNRPIKLSEYLKQPSFIIHGQIIYPEDVIKYVCNKLGGAHYDTSRKSKETKFVILG